MSDMTEWNLFSPFPSWNYLGYKIEAGITPEVLLITKAKYEYYILYSI